MRKEHRENIPEIYGPPNKLSWEFITTTLWGNLSPGEELSGGISRKGHLNIQYAQEARGKIEYE